MALPKLLHSDKSHWFDTFLVVINAIIITCYNMGTFSAMPELHNTLGIIIYGFLGLFIVLEAIKFINTPKTFFKDHRNIFAASILVFAAVLNIPDLTILLVFNSLRSLRLVTFFPKTRHVIDALFHSLPGVINLIVLIAISYFIFAVLATNLFGEKVPELWGSIPKSLISLQQIMLGDDWGNNLRSTLNHYPYAWIFSNAFLVIVGFVLLNVFVGVIVDAMQAAEEGDDDEDDVAALRKELTNLKKDLHRIQETCEKIKDSLSK